VPGRDDEFVAVILKTYTGMRWGEVVGLETRFAYVFRGQGTARTAGHRGAKLVDVARRGDVWTGAVSNVLNHPQRVREGTRVHRGCAVFLTTVGVACTGVPGQLRALDSRTRRSGA